MKDEDNANIKLLIMLILSPDTSFSPMVIYIIKFIEHEDL